MNRVSLIVATLLLVLGLSGTASAQNGKFAPYVDAGIGISSTLSGTGSLTSSNPNFRVGVGVESSSKYVLLDINGQFDTQNIRSFTSLSGLRGGDSYKGTVNASGYLKLNHLLVGVGARWSDRITDPNFKGLIPTSINELTSYVSAGAQFGRDRVTVSYVLPGRNAEYHAREVDFHNEIFLTKGAHFRLTQDLVGISSTPGNLGGRRVTGGSGSVGLKVVI